MSQDTGRHPLKVFCSYSHADTRYRDELHKHLKPLERDGCISLWYDGAINPGEELDSTIRQHLAEAEIILLLISPDFLASPYCCEVEMTQALQRNDAGTARVVPVVLRSCRWRTAPFGKLKALPKDGKAITKWSDEDEAFMDVAEGISRVIEQMARTGDGQAIPPGPCGPRAENGGVPADMYCRLDAMCVTIEELLNPATGFPQAKLASTTEVANTFRNHFQQHRYRFAATLCGAVDTLWEAAKQAIHAYEDFHVHRERYGMQRAREALERLRHSRALVDQEMRRHR